MQQQREGWTWKNGYWSKNKSENRTKLYKEFFCPHCKRPTGTIDDKFLETIGICAECYVLYVEARKVPTVDLSKYSKIDLSNKDLSSQNFLK